jgi:quaternary ammonium compound-resistance protein SugE
MVAVGTASFYLLSLFMKSRPGTAYAVWTDIGAAGTIVLGILLLGESGGPFRVLFLMLIVAGVIG